MEETKKEFNFQIEEGIEYKAPERIKKKGEGYVPKVVETCIAMKENTSFLIPKETFKARKPDSTWETDPKFRASVLTGLRTTLKDKLTNITEYKMTTTDGGIRIWFKPFIKAN